MIGRCYSVARHARVDGARPVVDASRKRLDVFESLVTQPHGDAERALSVVAYDYDWLVGVEFLVGAGGDFAHRHEQRVGQVGCIEFPGLAHV